MLLKRAERRRKDFVGASAADLDVTRVVLHADKHTQHVRYLAGLTPSAGCLFCDGDAEDVFHVIWSCPCWQSIRDGTLLRLRPGRLCRLCSLASSRLARST